MGKYKKWKQLVSVSTAACMAISAVSLTGCGGGNDSGSSLAGNENAEKKDASGSGESKAMGRYLEEELAVPKDCMEISSLQILIFGSSPFCFQKTACPSDRLRSFSYQRTLALMTVAFR